MLCGFTSGSCASVQENKPGKPKRCTRRLQVRPSSIQGKADKGLAEAVVDPSAEDNPENAGKEQIRLVDLAYSLVKHSGEVYGQLTVYYRAAGIVPPESRPIS